MALVRAAFYVKTVVNNLERKLAVAIALKIDQGNVYSTLISDFMKNKGDEKKMVKIPTPPAVALA